MGHVLLGSLPRTRQWNQVVDLITAGAGTQQVAQATLAAAEKSFCKAATDKGLQESVWLLMQLPTAARSEDFAESLRQCNMNVSNNPSLMEITSAFSQAVDMRLAKNIGRTDTGEMAQMAAVETIAGFVGEKTRSLFTRTPDHVQDAFAKLAIVKQFGLFARHFFARFINKTLNYFLSRTLPNHVGASMRFTTLDQVHAFTEALEKHCSEAARIVEQYAGDWFSKTHWLREYVSREEAVNFTSFAMTKLIAELREGAPTHGQ